MRSPSRSHRQWPRAKSPPNPRSGFLRPLPASRQGRGRGPRAGPRNTPQCREMCAAPGLESAGVEGTIWTRRRSSGAQATQIAPALLHQRARDQRVEESARCGDGWCAPSPSAPSCPACSRGHQRGGPPSAAAPSNCSVRSISWTMGVRRPSRPARPGRVPAVASAAARRPLRRQHDAPLRSRDARNRLARIGQNAGRPSPRLPAGRRKGGSSAARRDRLQRQGPGAREPEATPACPVRTAGSPSPTEPEAAPPARSPSRNAVRVPPPRARALPVVTTIASSPPRDAHHHGRSHRRGERRNRRRRGQIINRRRRV